MIDDFMVPGRRYHSCRPISRGLSPGVFKRPPAFASDASHPQPRAPFGPLRGLISAKCGMTRTPWCKTRRSPTALGAIRRSRRLASNDLHFVCGYAAGCHFSTAEGKARCGWGRSPGTARNRYSPWFCLIPPPRRFRTGPPFSTERHWVSEYWARLSMRSRPTSCSSRSTSGRRSTSRRPALTPPSTPERARLPQPPCLPPARVTVVLSYMRLAGVIRSGPFPRCGRG